MTDTHVARDLVHFHKHTVFARGCGMHPVSVAGQVTFSRIWTSWILQSKNS